MDESLAIFLLSTVMGFLMCFSIGANDVSNSASTVVGSKIMTLRQAFISIGLAEFVGSSVGVNVSDTLRRKLIHAELFADEPELLMAGFLSALFGCMLWLIIAAKMGWPVSTTHSMVGAVFSFALVAHGSKAVKWSQILRIVISWVVSPLSGGLASIGMYLLCKKLVFGRESPAQAGYQTLWFIYFLCSFAFFIFIFYEVISQWTDGPIPGAVIWTLSPSLAAIVAAGFHYHLLRMKAQRKTSERVEEEIGGRAHHGSINHYPSHEQVHLITGPASDDEDHEDSVQLSSSDGEQLQMKSSSEKSDGYLESVDFLSRSEGPVPIDVLVESDPECSHVRQAFVWLQIATCILVALGHGMNDISNATGPFSAILAIHQTKDVESDKEMDKWILVIAGFALVIGLSTMGVNVIRTVGTKLTQVTPVTGFCMQFGTAFTVMIASAMGLPVSTTHTLVGAVTCLGLLRLGRKGVDMVILKKILLSWGVTIPAAAIPTLGMFLIFKYA